MAFGQPLRVPYNVPGSPYWQWISIYTRLSEERIIFLNQPLSMGFANSLVSALLYLDSKDQSKPIYLYINSLGDPVDAGMADATVGMMAITGALAVYDTIEHIKSEVITICMGQAIGMAAFLLSSGKKGKRVSLPHAMIALKHSQIGWQGQATDFQINAKEMLDKKALLLKLMAANTGQSAEKIAKDMDRIFYMTPEEAKAYGLIDRIITSTKDVTQPVLTTSA
ncbi:ATP-dependent Clp protease proteolytic subunit [Merismopedia glauca]|uniref:ATP-dependent Clp protease proteolytic subunit n=1 Tax=Merismopedia glauca CCAP 1448/3 TaxID=1296344 RepID=A0A2T1C022_9CYAN|nr:ATP-dependent Clp protease proteolytic subunit [Merismopedia glauca]PSB01473.1 ATP-dependent Clp protease proteolytic subunit [Merismopedia glauca CCAP 1448/3]